MLLKESARGKVIQKERSQNAESQLQGQGKSEHGTASPCGRSLRPGQNSVPWILTAPDFLTVHDDNDHPGPLLLCNKPPSKHSGFKQQESFSLLVNLQFGQSLAETTCLCSPKPGASGGMTGDPDHR